MKRYVSTLISVVISAIFFSGCVNQSVVQETSKTDGIFIHVTQGVENGHRVLMALQMADIMKDTRPVLMYFDIKGPEVLRTDASDIQMQPFGSMKQKLRTLIDQGVHIRACPGCMKKLGIAPTDLLDGVQIADKDEFFHFADGRILTLDY